MNSANEAYAFINEPCCIFSFIYFIYLLTYLFIYFEAPAFIIANKLCDLIYHVLLTYFCSFY